MIKPLRLPTVLALSALPFSAHAVSLRLHSQAWTQAGQIMHATDTLQANFNGNREQSMGMQVNGAVELGENLEGGFGFGMSQVYHSLGDLQQEKFTLSKFINYVSEARVTYTLGGTGNHVFSATLGDFAYNYQPEVKNLGLYLFRGPVYPGFLVSGFEDFHTDTTRASFLGIHLHHAIGSFQHDLILSSERDLPPSFDWSLGYVAKYRPMDGLEIGAGVNFYHLIPDNADITTPSDRAVPGLFSKDSNLIAAGGPVDPYQLQYMEVTAPGDTVVYTHQGTKLMAMFDFDIKQAFGLNSGFGKKDLILYGEGAVIGVKNQGTIYAHIRTGCRSCSGSTCPSWACWISCPWKWNATRPNTKPTIASSVTISRCISRTSRHPLYWSKSSLPRSRYRPRTWRGTVTPSLPKAIS